MDIHDKKRENESDRLIHPRRIMIISRSKSTQSTQLHIRSGRAAAAAAAAATTTTATGDRLHSPLTAVSTL
jgi:hypothetical protein